jgi:hypothetical protein
MSTSATAQTATFDLLSQTARQRLKARVSDAGGTISTVRDEVAAALAALDHDPDTGATKQADRAFHIAQLTYLDHLEQTEQSDEPVQRRGFWSRLRRSNSRT